MDRDELNRQSYMEAHATCPEGQMVCATLLKDGRPLYFHMPVDAPDDAIRDEAFRLREGRPLSAYERQVMAEAELHRAG